MADSIVNDWPHVTTSYELLYISRAEYSADDAEGTFGNSSRFIQYGAGVGKRAQCLPRVKDASENGHGSDERVAAAANEESG